MIYVKKMLENAGTVIQLFMLPFRLLQIFVNFALLPGISGQLNWGCFFNRFSFFQEDFFLGKIVRDMFTWKASKMTKYLNIMEK